MPHRHRSRRAPGDHHPGPGFDTKLATEDALIDAINAIKAAAANPNADAALLDEARHLHRKAQFMWDFVSAENSMGFHNPEYILKILADSTNLARQAQMLAAQSVNDPSLLQTGTYYEAQTDAPAATGAVLP